MKDINLPSPIKYDTSEIVMFLSQVVMHNSFYVDDLEFQCPPGDDRSRHTGIAVFLHWSAFSVDKENRVVVKNEPDMTSAFYVFRLEPVCYYSRPVSGQFASRWVPNLWAEESVYPQVAVMAMGWKSSCGLLQQVHRKLCFLPKPMEAALDPSS